MDKNRSITLFRIIFFSPYLNVIKNLVTSTRTSIENKFNCKTSVFYFSGKEKFSILKAPKIYGATRKIFTTVENRCVLTFQIEENQKIEFLKMDFLKYISFPDSVSLSLQTKNNLENKFVTLFSHNTDKRDSYKVLKKEDFYKRGN